MKDPDTLFTIKESNVVASNGIIHIIDKPITNLPADASSNPKVYSLTNRFYECHAVFHKC